MMSKKDNGTVGAVGTALLKAAGSAAAGNPANDEPNGTAGDIPGEDRAIYRKEHDPRPQPADDNPSVVQQKQAMKDAMGQLAYAATFMVNIPDPDGDRDVDFVSDEQNGEVVTVRCRAANRYGRTQRGLLDQLLRQLNFALEQDKKAIAQEQSALRGMFNSLTRSDNPESVRNAMERKADWIDVIVDRAAHTQALLDAANEAYIDLTGTAYVAYEKRTPRTLSVPAAPAGDDLLSRCRALITG